MMVIYFVLGFIVCSFLVINIAKNIVTRSSNPHYHCYWSIKDMKRYYNCSMGFMNTTFNFDNTWGILMAPTTFTWFIVKCYSDRANRDYWKNKLYYNNKVKV